VKDLDSLVADYGDFATAFPQLRLTLSSIRGDVTATHVSP
jgi:hypothetical protein